MVAISIRGFGILSIGQYIITDKNISLVLGINPHSSKKYKRKTKRCYESSHIVQRVTAKETIEVVQTFGIKGITSTTYQK